MPGSFHFIGIFNIHIFFPIARNIKKIYKHSSQQKNVESGDGADRWRLGYKIPT